MSPKPRISPRKTPKQSRAEATVDAILDALARLLIDVGYQRATTNRIAERAGVSIGTLYQYFPTKDAVIAALVSRHIARMEAVLSERADRFADAPLDVFARAMITGLFEAHAVDPKLHRAMLEQIPKVEQNERLLALERNVQSKVEAVLDRHAAKLRPRDTGIAALVLAQAVMGTAHAALFDDSLRARSPEAIEQLVDLTLRYLMA